MIETFEPVARTVARAEMECGDDPDDEPGSRFRGVGLDERSGAIVGLHFHRAVREFKYERAQPSGVSHRNHAETVRP